MDQLEDIPSCPHIRQVLDAKARDNVVITYKQAVKISLLINPQNKFKAVKDGCKITESKLEDLKLNSLKCVGCSSNNFNNNLVCLQCPNVGCKIHNHAYTHFKKTQHVFAIDSNNGILFCFRCKNYVNEAVLTNIRKEVLQTTKAHTSLNAVDASGSDLDNYYENPSNVHGLKGFINLGSTCFMSSILQTFIHNPIVKYEFFNNDDHFFECEKSQCITCSIDTIFKDFYTSTNNDSFGMTNLLINAWYKNESLAGFQEQDAHEFWQFLLNEFHKEYEAIKGEQLECRCITHKVFSGELESSIKCTNCNEVTIKNDPIMDLSLELTNLAKNATLYDCLNLFTSDEKLDIEYNCQFCESISKPVKSLKLLKLAPIVSIQLKRFKHNYNNFVKNEIPIKIPLYLNLSRYVATNSIDTQHFYELFALVCHIGSVHTGHYIAYIKNSNSQWLRFDDSVITLVSQDEISNLNAYLLFYIAHPI